MNRFQYIWQSITLSLTRKALLATLTLATVLLTIGYLMGGLLVETPVVFLVGVLWIVCVLRDLRWAASPLFVLMLGLVAVGHVARLSNIVMFAVGCMSVLAWDLQHFEARILDIREQATQEMEKMHLQRVLMVITGSFGLMVIDSWLKVRFRFIVLVLVTVLAVVILNQLMLAVRKPSKPVPPKH
jgi:hypothetical protein